MKSAFTIGLLLASTVLQAGDVTIKHAEAAMESNNHYRFSVTLEHSDTGWEHYADQWQVLTTTGEALGTRTLLHPHVNEQPFTRSLGDVRVPEHINRVIIRARDSVHGVSTQQYQLELPR